MMPPAMAVKGNVIAQVDMILPTIFHFTADILCAAPAPTTDDDITCVVLIGNPKIADTYTIAADAVCAEKPCTDRIR